MSAEDISYPLEWRGETAIKVNNSRSEISSLYQIDSPFQVTFESCSGTEPQDYINFITLTPEQHTFMQQSYYTHKYLYGRQPPHFHDYFEFLLVLEGCITQRIENKEYLYNAGSCCLINRSLLHKETFHSEAKILFLGFNPSFLKELFCYCQTAYFHSEKKILGSMLYDFIKSDLDSSEKKSYLDFIPTFKNAGAADWFHSLGEKLIQHLLYPAFGSTYMLKAVFASFFQYLSSSECFHVTHVGLETQSDFLLFSRISHLLEESSGRMSRTGLEKVLNYSGDYLNRIVKKYSGMCIFDYGMTFCLKKAAYYLANTDMPISEIIGRLHFSNKTHFYALFKSHYGITPKEYRDRR